MRNGKLIILPGFHAAFVANAPRPTCFILRLITVVLWFIVRYLRARTAPIQAHNSIEAPDRERDKDKRGPVVLSSGAEAR